MCELKEEKVEKEKDHSPSTMSKLNIFQISSALYDFTIENTFKRKNGHDEIRSLFI